MTNLSPAAQAVLNAAMQYEINPECYSREIAIATLRTLASQCLHETPKGVHGDHAKRYILAAELRHIATQLEGLG